ncbi:MAG: hypothetical protein RBT41_02155 [Clostridia bacterium]|jgi:hypothetical protein|nr:hypothetical protein [Clostridia bacterium]
MRNKLLSQLFFFCLLLLTWWNINDLRATLPTGAKIGAPLPVFPGIQIDFLRSQDPVIVEDALNQTARVLARYISPALTNEAWQPSFVFLDLFGDEKEELAISLALPPDRGYLAIIARQNGQYTLYYYLDNLLPLGNISKLDLPGHKNLLVTREEHDEQMGIYSETKTLKLWKWRENALQAVWSEHSYWEMSWLNTWQDSQADSQLWSKLVQDLSVTYEAAPDPMIKIEGEQYLHQAPFKEFEILPPPYEFELQIQRKVEAVYIWNEEWQCFVLESKTLQLPGQEAQKVALIKDLGFQLESLVKQELKSLYQVINKKGEIFEVEKQYLR